MTRRFSISCLVLFLSYLGYAVWTYTQTDPNLVISQWEPFWQFQQWAWQLPDHFVTQVYIGLVGLSVISYFFLIQTSKALDLSLRKILIILMLVTLPLFFSNNALSHDIFNYMFNALMVVKYGANPHVKTALDFSFEPWTRFMHNVHTPAPYFYGWTALSTIPYILGFEKFLLTWFLFRVWSAIGFFASVYFVWHMMQDFSKEQKQSFYILAFSPLMAIELISNAHNDGWMIWPAFASITLLLYFSKKWFVLKLILSVLLLLLSLSTKYVTVLILPLWFYTLSQSLPIANIVQRVFRKTTVTDITSMLHFAPLLTERSKFFLPWYLSWSFFYYPLIKNDLLKVSLFVFSVSSLFRYVPWLWNGGFAYTPAIEMQQKLITYIPALVLVPLYFLFKHFIQKKG